MEGCRGAKQRPDMANRTHLTPEVDESLSGITTKCLRSCSRLTNTNSSGLAPPLPLCQLVGGPS